MKKLRYIFTALLALLMSGCFEDKGNYEYKELLFPEITMDWTHYPVLEEKFEIDPKEVVYPESKTVDDYKFEWYVKGIKIGEGCPLVLEKYQGPLGSWSSYVVITEKESGIRQMNKFMINASSPKQSGWLILGEKDGKSRLDFVQVIIEEEKPVYKKLHENLIPDLAPDPKRMVEHWADANDLGQVAVICGNNQAAEYNGDLNKVIDIQREFIGLNYPAGFTLDNTCYLIFNSLAYSVGGNMYARYNNIQEAYQTGSYMQVPLYPEKGMEVGFTVTSRVRKTNQAMIYDSKNNRFLIMFDENASVAGKIAPITIYNKNQDMSKIFPLDDIGAGNKVLACVAHTPGYWRGWYVALIKGADGKTYTQEFYIDVNDRKNAKASEIVVRRELTNGSLLGDDAKMVICTDEPDRSFYASGDKVYYMTRQGTELKQFASFSGVKVVSIAADVTKYGSTRSNRQLGVALEDGTFKVFDITVPGIDSAVEGNPIVLFECKKMNKIVNVIHKQGVRNITDM